MMVGLAVLYTLYGGYQRPYESGKKLTPHGRSWRKRNDLSHSYHKKELVFL